MLFSYLPRYVGNVFPPQLKKGMQNFIFQQDGAAPHWHLEFRKFNYHTTGLVAMQPMIWSYTAPRSADLTPCESFLWGHVKDFVFIPPLPTRKCDKYKNNCIAIYI